MSTLGHKRTIAKWGRWIGHAISFQLFLRRRELNEGIQILREPEVEELLALNTK